MSAQAFSIWVFLGLLVALGASCLMFWVHVRRWTGNRQWLNLRDWANATGFRMHRPDRATLPPAMAGLSAPPPAVLLSLTGRRFALVQMQTDARPGDAGDGGSRRWNVLVRDIGAFWPTTALRPSQHERSLVDLFALGAFPAMLSSERFTIHGADAPAARVVVASMLMALLPQDLGMILSGRTLILDFSTRPFDGIELSRIVALADQLAGHLPILPK